MELKNKSLLTLELPAVLSMLSERAVSEPAKTAALELRPSEEKTEVLRRLEETSAARKMMDIKGAPSFSGVKDVRSALARADLGGALNTRELMDIAGVLSCARTVRAYVGDGEKTRIDFLFQSLTANKYLEDRINGAIVGEDEIADGASPELNTIRRQIRAASSRVREALQKIISSPSYSKALQEPIITTRSERFVVPVKSEYKSSVPGLVHDVSASGATLFVEPMAAVKANNELRELRAKEKTEIERILMELSAECAAHRGDITFNYETLVTLDLIFAKGKLSYNLDCMEPELSDGEIRLNRARHPLLSRDSAVPIDIELGGGFDTLIITGPNTGGKTVTLKTIGLLCLMACCGLHLPVGGGSRLPVFKKILADIGDEQSIEQSLSTFSAHMTNIVGILSECDADSLLLFDELGAGTDPTEGAALAMAIIEYGRKTGAAIAATTHYAELKVYATTAKGVQNASCEFDVETLCPTYRLLIGIPGKSNAFAISRRLGLPETVITDAASRVNTEAASFEEIIEKLQLQRQQMDKEKLEIDRLRRETEENTKKSERLRRELEVRLDKADEKAKREAQRIIDDARSAAELAFSELDRLRSMQNEEKNHQRVNEARSELRRQLNEAEEELRHTEAAPAEEKKSSRPVVPGDTVEIISMGIKASVISVAADRTLTLRAGIMNVTAAESEVFLLDIPKSAVVSSTVEKTGVKLRETALTSELDLRGMTADDAVTVMENYLDSAIMGKLNTVTIIHGKGTGALRTAVQQSLKRNKRIKSFRLGRYGEGEAGVTIVELK